MVLESDGMVLQSSGIGAGEWYWRVTVMVLERNGNGVGE
jgi:hypothetical protein